MKIKESKRNTILKFLGVIAGAVISIGTLVLESYLICKTSTKISNMINK